MSLTKSIAERVRRKLAASQYLRDVLLQASGNTAAQVIGIAAMPVLTRLYAPSDFAALHLFSQLVAGFAILLTLRFEYLVMLPADQHESDRVLGIVFRLGAIHVVWLTPFLVLLPKHWSWLQSQGSIVDWMWLVPVSAWALSLAVGLQQSVQRKGDFKTTATAEFFGRCTYVVATLLGALALPNIVGLMSSTLANATGKLSWLLRVGGVLPRSLWQFSGPPIAKSIRRLALSTSASNLISLVSGFAPMIFIADRYGASALGQYGLVVSTLYLPSTLIGQAIGQVYYQRACRMHGEGLAFHSLLIQTSIYLVRVAIPMYTFIAFIAPWAYPFIFGAAWEASGAMARWLCIAAAAGFISTPVDRSSIVVGAWWYLSIWHILCALMTGFALLASAILNLPVESCIILLALQKAVTYLIDWIASYSLSNGKYKTYLAFEPEREL